MFLHHIQDSKAILTPFSNSNFMTYNLPFIFYLFSPPRICPERILKVDIDIKTTTEITET